MRIDAEVKEHKLRLGRAIRARITDMGITQEKACELAGLHRPDLSKIVNGHVERHSLQKLMVTAQSLGIQVDLTVLMPEDEGEAITPEAAFQGTMPQRHVIFSKGAFREMAHHERELLIRRGVPLGEGYDFLSAAQVNTPGSRAIRVALTKRDGCEVVEAQWEVRLAESDAGSCAVPLGARRSSTREYLANAVQRLASFMPRNGNMLPDHWGSLGCSAEEMAWLMGFGKSAYPEVLQEGFAVVYRLVCDEFQYDYGTTTTVQTFHDFAVASSEAARLRTTLGEVDGEEDRRVYYRIIPEILRLPAGGATGFQRATHVFDVLEPYDLISKVW